MHVLILSDLWPPFPGGAERLMFNIGRDLARRGANVDVLTGYEYPEQFDGPPVTQNLGIGVADDRALGGAVIEEALVEFEPDIVMAHHLYAHQFAPELMCARRGGRMIPVVHVVLNGLRLPGAALGVYITNWVRDRAQAKPDDLVLLPPAFDDVVAASHGDAIGFIKPIPHKGADLVYQVARLLPQYQFVVLRGEWQDLEVPQPELPNVEWLEPVDDIRKFYERVRLVLMPSLSEDAGTVAQECALNGIPCLSTNVDGLAETNLGGPQLLPDDFDGFVRWTHWLMTMPGLYGSVVAEQRSGQARREQDAGLAVLAARMEALAG